MKTILPLKQHILKSVLFTFLAVAVTGSQAQQYSFRNPTLEPGSPAAGTDGATYRFKNVASNLDALVKINGRSSALVKLSNIDVANMGFDKAFQPQISYNNGNTSVAGSWWMEFLITFVTNNTTTPVQLSNVYSTALDIDGDDNKLHELVSFFQPSSYTLENPTKLSVSNLAQTILGILTNVGKTFDGIIQDHGGIDTSSTDLMVTAQYNSISSLKYRTGASTTGASSKTERNYSVYFKNFNYSAPIITLPVKLESFTANLNGNKVDLKWITSQEMNVSHFVIEKSVDGKNFSDAGLVFAYGNTAEKVNYSFSDNVSNMQGVIYYRLRSVDNDGKLQLSEIRLIRISKQSETAKMVTYPNPVSNELRITVPASWQGKDAMFEIFSQNGQRIKSVRTASVSQTETIAVNDLSTGFYLVRATCGSDVAQQKIIKY